MPTESFNLKIVVILTIGFGLASLFGYLAHRIKLSPIIGYLLVGYLIGPYSPGYVADLKLADQLAEIGVILMMFGVGLHFKWQDLVKVKNIAVPGAIFQTAIVTIIGATLVNYYMGWSAESGIVFGLAMAVASTVVLVRLLSDRGLVDTLEGHITIGWLVVEDVITVFALLLIPALQESLYGTGFSWTSLIYTIMISFSKFIVLVGFMFTIGRKIVEYIIAKVMVINSHELFTVTILALTFLIATGSAHLFGISIALGAFIAGMLMGQTEMRRKVSNNSMPMKDAFVVIFFLAVGMIFNPDVIYDQFSLFLLGLAIILILKPITALVITIILKYPFKTALTIGLGLAQIGEFSFILAEEAMRFNVLPDDGYDLVVACSIVSIVLNPLLFKIKDCLFTPTPVGGN